MRHVYNSNNMMSKFTMTDEEFNTYSYKTKSNKYIILISSKTISDEIRYIDADNPLGRLRLFQEKLMN